MAPLGRPNDPRDPRRAGKPDPDDWDWGDEEWDEAPAASRAARSANRTRPGPSARTGSGAPDRRTEADHASGPDDADPGRAWPDDPSASAGAIGSDAARDREDSRGNGNRPRDRNGSPGGVIRRRRLLAGSGVLVALLLVILVVAALTSGGDDDTQAASVPLLAGPMQAASTASVDHLERARAVDRFAELGRPVFCGGGKKPWVALTYDDGPGALSPKFISLLSKERIPVTSFRVGSAVPGNERYAIAQRNLGWDSGTHTQNHPDLTKLTESEQRREIAGGIDASTRALGRRPQLFRPPYQAHNATTDKLIEQLGQVQVLWNVDTQDSLGPTTVDKIVKNAVEGLRPGSIILMHEIKDQTFKAMPAIIKAMRARNLQPVTVSQMLAGDPPSEQQLRQGYDGCMTREAAGPGEQNRPGEVGGPEAT